MKKTISFLLVPALVLAVICPVLAADGYKLLPPIIRQDNPAPEIESQPNPMATLNRPSTRNLLGLDRDKPWRLPTQGLASAAEPRTLKILVMRFDFVEDDDPLTTGNGKFDFRDFYTFYEEEGHVIDPAPRNREFFEKHLEALDNYYQAVSESTLVLDYIVYPLESDSVYHLPQTMTHYGERRPEFGIAEMYIDCMTLVDTTEPEITFADYDSYFIFHAGSDRQDDVIPAGYPGSTPNDLYAGFIVMGDPVYVDDSTYEVREALVMPETGSQDGRVVALNATIAHEFGHQLGLIDLYNTGTSPFITRVGDFALMDNMGRGTVVNLEMPAGPVSDMFPVYLTAWSRSFLGFVEPTVLKQGISLELAAAGMYDAGLEVVKVPISEFEYYLIENRQVDIDGEETFPIADSATTVIMGPGKPVIDPISGDTNLVLTGEYDVLMPGSGILIWHVNESIASDEIMIVSNFTINAPIGDYPDSVITDTTILTRYDANMMQVLVDRPFLELVEADGFQQFGRGYYVPGYIGIQEDMYYLGNNTSLTPNSNPPSRTFAGANSDIYITDVSASDTIMTFTIGSDFTSSGFPCRVGYPAIPFSPHATDLDGDGITELIIGNGDNLLVMDENGDEYWSYEPTPYYDTAYSSTGSRAFTLPVFANFDGDIITADIAVSDFGLGTGEQYIAAGVGNMLYVFTTTDDSPADGLPDYLFDPVALPGGNQILWMAFQDSILNALSARPVLPGGVEIHLTTYNSLGARADVFPTIVDNPLLYGAVVLEDNFAVIAGDGITTRLFYISAAGDSTSLDLEGEFVQGPVAGDLDRDGTPEVVVATVDGFIKVVSIDTSTVTPSFSVMETDLYDVISVNPVLADLDNDGYPDIIVGGENRIYALDKNLVSLIDYPITIDRAYPAATIVSAPVVADINNDGRQDIVVTTSEGNCYAFGPDPLYGFPVSSGGVMSDSILTYDGDGGGDFVYTGVFGVGSPVLFTKQNGGGVAFPGADGWIYSYDVRFDSARADWAMSGGDASGGYYFEDELAGSTPAANSDLPQERLFCYPNPSLDGITTLRYFIGDDARVTLNVYDLTGVLVYEDYYNGRAGNNEEQLSLAFLPTGVYRCKVKADFNGASSAAFTDIAIVK